MWGKTEQVVTSGAQLLRNDLSKKQTGKGLTIELNNCMVSFKGTIIDDGTPGRPVLDVILNKDAFTGKILSLISDDSRLYLLFRIEYTDGRNEYSIKEATIDETVKNVFARFFYRESTPPVGTMISETHKVMLCESKNKGKPWEPYSGGKPSPSPDYPRPIEITDQPVTVTVKGGTEQQSITLIPPRPFTKWDKLEKVDGVWCWVYQTTEFELNGTETWNRYGDLESTGIVFTTYFANTLPGLQSTICDKYLNKNNAWGTDNKNSYGIYGDHPSSLSRYFRMPNTQITTPEQWKEWLGNHPLRFMCKSSTQESIPLSLSEQDKLNALTMYAPETEVTNTGGCNMELTYTVDTKSYVDSKIAAISAAVLEV